MKDCLNPPLRHAVQLLVRRRVGVPPWRFASEAIERLGQNEDWLPCPLAGGLLLYGSNEEVLQCPLQTLQDMYGTAIQIGEPQARYVEDDALLEPIMHLRVRAPIHQAEAVRREVLLRQGRILEQDLIPLRGVPAREVVLRALAPMARLIGFAGTMSRVAGNGVQHVISLQSYVPVATGTRMS